MRFGKLTKSVNEVTIAVPRGKDFLEFKLVPISREQKLQFEKLYPIPNPPNITRFTDNGPVKSKDVLNEEFLKKVDARSNAYASWMFLCALKGTSELVFEKVDEAKPETWNKIEEELTEFGLVDNEISMITQGVMRANGLDAKFIERAEERFSVTQANQAVAK